MEPRDWKEIKLGDVDEVVRVILQKELDPDEALHAVTMLAEALADIVDEAVAATRKPWQAWALAAAAETIRGVPRLVKRALDGGFKRDGQ